MANPTISMEMRRYGIPLAVAGAGLIAFFALGGPDDLIRKGEATPTDWNQPRLTTFTPSATPTGGWWDELPTKIELPTARPTSAVNTAAPNAVQDSPTPELHMDPTVTFDSPGGD
jgi:hypothetical protein